MTAHDLLRRLGPAIARGRRIADLKHAAMVGFAVFATALAGILSRDSTTLATFWPANALMLGLLLRKPERIGPWHWLIATACFMAADLITGSAPLRSLLLTSANLAGVAPAFFAVRWMTRAQPLVQTPNLLLVMGVAAVIGSFSAACWGAIILPLLMGAPTLLMGWNWFVAELVNYCALLPLIMTFPTTLWRDRTKLLAQLQEQPEHLLPVVLFVASAIAGHMIGGLPSVAVPIPALLWCAMRYPFWTTSILVLGFNLWAIFVLSAKLRALMPDLDIRDTLMSMRLVLVFISIAPLSVSSLATSRDELLRRLQHMADHDQLTGALNRHGFQSRAADILLRCTRHRKPIALLMLDLDHFKQINDQYGHRAGDIVLASFVERAAHVAGDNVPFGRLGGEEFALIVEDCDQARGAELASSLRSAAADLAIDIGAAHPLRFSVSIGVALCNDGQTKLEDLLAIADEALYRAKRNGRDRVETGELPSQPPHDRRRHRAA